MLKAMQEGRLITGSSQTKMLLSNNDQCRTTGTGTGAAGRCTTGIQGSNVAERRSCPPVEANNLRGDAPGQAAGRTAGIPAAVSARRADLALIWRDVPLRVMVWAVQTLPGVAVTAARRFVICLGLGRSWRGAHLAIIMHLDKQPVSSKRPREEAGACLCEPPSS